MINVRIVVCLLCVAHSSLAAEVSFDDLLKHPARFDRREVTVKGVLEVTGSVVLNLWRDANAYRRCDLKKNMSLLQRGKDIDQAVRTRPLRAPHSEANLHWVKVTAIVDRRFHGMFSDEAFQLVLKHMQTLPLPPVPER
jgi:hypothetical protein